MSILHSCDSDGKGRLPPVRNRRNGIGVRRSCFGGKTSSYFLTSECSGYFRFISGYVGLLTSDIGNWSSQTSLTSFCRYIHFLSEFYFRSGFHFRFDVHTSTSPRSWPGYHGGGRSCTRTGHGGCRVGSTVSRGAGTESNSPDRSVRPTLRFGSESIGPYQLPAISSNYLLT